VPAAGASASASVTAFEASSGPPQPLTRRRAAKSIAMVKNVNQLFRLNKDHPFFRFFIFIN
jgi:hypothetical protein